MLEISTAELAEVVSILDRFVPEHEVWAFGSRVNGTARPFSDLDLVVMTEKPLDDLARMEMSQAFSESNLPFTIDLLDWAKTSESFRRIIEQDYQIIKTASRPSNEKG